MSYFELSFLSHRRRHAGASRDRARPSSSCRRFRPVGRRRHLARQRGARHQHAGQRSTQRCCRALDRHRRRHGYRAPSTASSSPFLRLQPIVVTLVDDVHRPGRDPARSWTSRAASVAARLSEALVGDAIPGWLPMPLVVLGNRRSFCWCWLKNTRFGTAIYAIGSDVDAARAQGISVAWTQFLVYVARRRLLRSRRRLHQRPDRRRRSAHRQRHAAADVRAVVVGGTRLGGGRGGPIGSIFGAYILMIVVNILLVLNVSAYYSTIAEGVILHPRGPRRGVVAIIARQRAQPPDAAPIGAPGIEACCHARDGACRSVWRFRPRKRPRHRPRQRVIHRAAWREAALRVTGLCVLPAGAAA